MPQDSSFTPRPVRKSLGVRSGQRLWVGGHNLAAKREIEKYLTGTVRPATGPVDMAFITPEVIDEAVYFASKIRARLSPEGSLCVVVQEGNPAEATPHFSSNEELVSRLEDAGFCETEVVPLGGSFRVIRFAQSSSS